MESSLTDITRANLRIDTLSLQLRQAESKVEERDREVDLLNNAREMAQRALPLTRKPTTPTGGMRTGDSLEVGQRDWYALLRIARYLTTLAAEEKPNA